MAGGDGGSFPKLPPDKTEDGGAETGWSFGGVRLSDAPILFLVYFHKALRLELGELRRLAFTEWENGSRDSEVLGELHRRFEFLKVVYKYHCAAEDEVIFLALDARIINVVHAYSLEHESIDNLFEVVFHCLDIIKEEAENISTFEELVLCIGTIHTSICQHMLKEEEQVFPLLIEQFSSTEQASLVWQFICSVPIVLLEDLLPWTISFLCPEERVEIINCIKDIVPKEKLLQEVIISWLSNNKHSPFGDNEIGQGAQSPSGYDNIKSILKLYASKCSFGENWNRKKEKCLQTNVGNNPIEGLHLWHKAIRKDLNGILEELYHTRSSNNFSNIASLVLQLKFLADTLIFYSNALEKFFYPTCRLSPSNERLIDEIKLEGLQRMLHYTSQNEIYSCKFVEKLCQKLDSLVIGIDRHFAFQEKEVFPVVTKHCSHEMQQRILYMSLHMMPLGLLKCVITWFSSHVSEDESRSILCKINQGDSFVNNSFASLLYNWFRIGYSGKKSVDQFRKDLQEMFKSRCSFLSEKIEEHNGCSSLHSHAVPIESSSTTRGKNCLPYSSSSGSSTTKKYDTSYASGINMHILYPGIKPHFPEFLVEMINEPQPMDLLFFFHKSLKKDLEYLVHGSAQLVENVGFLMDFRRRFHLIRFLYQIHTDAEDQVAFPALEAKGKLQNISHSYTIDHKLDEKYFNDISFTLDEMSELRTSFSTVDISTLDQKMLKYHQLCMKLHDMCKSVHKIVSDHTHREEIELWPLFRNCFSIEEQEKIIQCMLGRTSAEILQDMLPWLMASLTSEEKHNMMFLWRKATRNTMFDDWLGEWWEGYDITTQVEESNVPPSSTADSLHLWTYISKEVLGEQGGNFPDKDKIVPPKDSVDENFEPFGKHNMDRTEEIINDETQKCSKHFLKGDVKRSGEVAEVTKCLARPGQLLHINLNSSQRERLLTMSQEDLDAAIKRISFDSTLNPEERSYIIQNLLISRWIVTQQKSPSDIIVSSYDEKFPGQCPSYRGPLKLTFGCEHYKRNCKLVAACCNQLYTCKRCHDEVADHSLDRKSITQMMCMKCLVVQPIGTACSTASCNNLSMARYYCKICKLFDDEREIYHCPYCNLCRVGKGLGIDYFHCMNCNACMSRSLAVHVCREKCFEDNCPICHEFIFTSNSPVKALACGHLMHSACFQEYTCSHYTCPICSKSLGDMQVYFNMLDALLAEEKIPEEYSKQTQVILCNDCERRGSASFHWLYHKCSSCGSYNTRLL